MSFDTRNARASAVGFALPWMLTIPLPDATLVQADRIQTGYSYSEVRPTMAELTTVALVKSYLSLTGTSDDSLLDNLLGAAEQYIRGIANRPDGWLNTSAHTEKIPGSRFDNIPLIYTPVTAITSVTVVASSGDSTTVSSSYYRINDEQTAVLLSGNSATFAWDMGYDTSGLPQFGYPTGQRSYSYVEVVYTGGYASQADIPADLEQAANEYTAWMYWARKEFKPDDHEKWGELMRERLQRYVRMDVV